MAAPTYSAGTGAARTLAAITGSHSAGARNAVDPLARTLALSAHARLDDKDAHDAAADEHGQATDDRLDTLESEPGRGAPSPDDDAGAGDAGGASDDGT